MEMGGLLSSGSEAFFGVFLLCRTQMLDKLRDMQYCEKVSMIQFPTRLLNDVIFHNIKCICFLFLF